MRNPIQFIIHMKYDITYIALVGCITENLKNNVTFLTFLFA